MYSFQGIIVKLIYTVAVAVFDPIFFVIVYITYFLYKKNVGIEKHILSFSQESAFDKVIEATLYGIMIGILGSISMKWIGIPLEFTKTSLLLLPIAILMSLKNPRFACFSYATAILGIIKIVLIPQLNFDIPGMITLVGMLHLMEAVLVYTTGADGSIPIIIRRNGEHVGAYIMQKYWAVPMALMINTITFYPMCGLLGFGSIAVTSTPEKKAKKIGLALGIYATTILIGAIIVTKHSGVQLLIVILVPLLHELIYFIDRYLENNKKPIYVLPEKGVRVLEVVYNSPAYKMGIQRGDVIIKLNNIEIESITHYYRLIKREHNKVWLNILSINGQSKILEYEDYSQGITELGIVLLPKYSLCLYKIIE